MNGLLTELRKVLSVYETDSGRNFALAILCVTFLVLTALGILYHAGVRL